MIKHVIATALTLAAFSASAQVYGEIGYAKIQLKGGDLDQVETSPTAIRGIIGFEINPNFAIEGLAAFGMNDGDYKANKDKFRPPHAKIKIDNIFGIYAKPKIKFTPELEAFVRVGFAQTKGTYSYPDFQAGTNNFYPAYSKSSSAGNFSYGLGMSYALNKKTSLNVDYMSYFEKDGVKVASFTFGAGYKF